MDQEHHTDTASRFRPNVERVLEQIEHVINSLDVFDAEKWTEAVPVNDTEKKLIASWKTNYDLQGSAKFHRRCEEPTKEFQDFGFRLSMVESPHMCRSVSDRCDHWEKD